MVDAVVVAAAAGRGLLGGWNVVVVNFYKYTMISFYYDIGRILVLILTMADHESMKSNLCMGEDDLDNSREEDREEGEKGVNGTRKDTDEESAAKSPGHVFIILGDITKLACDAT